MFQRRKTRKPSFDFVASFNRDYPSLPGLLHQAHPGARQRPASSPLPSSSIREGIDFMSYDPRHFDSYEDPFEPDQDNLALASIDAVYGQPAESQAGQGPFSYGSSYMDFPTPSQWQQTPGGGAAAPFFAPHQLNMQYSWPSAFNPTGMPTPSSRSHSLPSPAQAAQMPLQQHAQHQQPQHQHHPQHQQQHQQQQQQQPAFLSLQDVQLQPSFSSIDFTSSYHSFSPQALSAQSPYRSQMGPASTGAGKALTAQLGARSVNTVKSGAPSDFRFHVSLINGTAMVKENEIPISYLNKRQTYKIRIRDTRPQQQAGSLPTTYRTFVRISFHEEKQRAHPDQHWQLWKEGRGMNEAQQHGGKLQAVEYVPSSQSSGHNVANVHVEKENFDGFCVTWTAPTASPPECEVQFRCNFLSTDFSRSKGVKGIPVRLCAKSEVVAFPSMDPAVMKAEVCYCKIKLFRDHGAERKLTNDESAVRRQISKTEEQIKQSRPDDDEAANAPNSSGKRRGSDSLHNVSRPSKISRHKRGGSVSSDNSSQDNDVPESELPIKVGTLNKLLRSRHDVTVLNLRGGEVDDPDLHPVSLLDAHVPASEEQSPDLKRVERRNTNVTKPSQMTDDPTHPVSPVALGLQLPTPATSHQPSADSSADSQRHSDSADPSTPLKQPSSSTARRAPSRRQTAASIEAIGIDPAYQAPSEPAAKPVACFYVQFAASGAAAPSSNHRAVYLLERSVAALVGALARKQEIDSSNVAETLFLEKEAQRDLRVQVDDEFVAHIPEGQDMEADFTPMPSSRGSSRRAHDQNTRYRLTIRY